MSTKSKIITVLSLVAALLIFSGCGKDRAVPTDDEIKKAMESNIKTFANLSPVKVAGIDSFEVLEVYDHNYDFSKLADKIQGKVDVAYLNNTKDMYKGDWAIVKASYELRFDDNAASAEDVSSEEDGVRSQWFLVQKPEQGDWEVGMVLTEPEQD